MPSSLTQTAAAFAARAHHGQVRKDGVTPYASHTARVALVISSRFGVHDDEVLAAALLHDVIEDCGVDYDDVEEAFGARVADFVAALSKDPRLPEAERERRYAEQLAEAPWEVRLIKLADVLDNLSDVREPVAAGRLLERARHAVAIAGDDDELAGPAEIVRRVIGIIAARFPTAQT